MTSFNHISVIFTREDDTSAWIAFDERREAWSAETMVRVTRGIRYREREYGAHCPTVERLRKDALSGGFFSQRPIYPGVPIDPSMVDCALALFGSFCASRGIDASALLRDQTFNIYRGNEGFARITEQAEWEGNKCPEVWNSLWVDTLVQSLEGVSYEYLSELVARTRRGGRS
jgi:hypothetical protein